MTLDVFRSRHLYFSAEAFLADMGRSAKGRMTGSTRWTDGRLCSPRPIPPAAETERSVTLGRIKGTQLLGVPRMVQERRRVKKNVK